MRILRSAALLALAWLIPFGRGAATAAELLPDHLRCEYRVDPLGIDVTRPRLSWVPRSTAPSAREQGQAAFRVLVAGSPDDLDSDRGDLWDSGKVTSASSRRGRDTPA